MANNRLTNVNSLMIAVILTSGLISRMFAALGIINEGLVPILFVLSLLISYITAFVTKNKFKIEINGVSIIYFILFIFVLTFLYRGVDSYVSKYFVDFLFFGISTYLLSTMSFSPSKVMYFTMVIGNIVLISPMAFLNYISLDFSYDSVRMGATYAMLPSIVAAIIYLFFIKKKGKRIINFVSYFSNGYLLFLLITEGTRGAVLAISLLFCVITYITISKRMKKNIGFLYPMFLVIINISVILFIINIQKLFFWLYSFLQSKEIEIATITKTVNMIESQGMLGVLNARDRVYERGIQLFEVSPIWGHGIGSYADIYWGTYPHNFLLQLLVEGGLLFALPFLMIFIYILWLIIKPWSNEEIHNETRLFLLFLFIICIPKLMLSSYLWQEQSFWLLIFVLLSISTKLKRESCLNVNSFKRI